MQLVQIYDAAAEPLERRAARALEDLVVVAMRLARARLNGTTDGRTAQARGRKAAVDLHPLKGAQRPPREVHGLAPLRVEGNAVDVHRHLAQSSTANGDALKVILITKALQNHPWRTVDQGPQTHPWPQRAIDGEHADRCWRVPVFPARQALADHHHLL